MQIPDNLPSDKDAVVGKISVITPTYNEVDNIGNLLEALCTTLEDRDFEVIVVDDNSSDGTREIVREFSKKRPNIRLLPRPKKMGIGSSYKEGFQISKGDIIVVMDADLSHRPADIPTLLNALKDADIAVGSRHVKDGGVVGWEVHRVLIHRGANILASIILTIGIADSTSGFKAYRRKAFEKIAALSKFNGFSDFEVESLFLAKKLGLRVVEVPIIFMNRTIGDSKIRIMDILSYFRSLIKLRFRRVPESP